LLSNENLSAPQLAEQCRARSLEKSLGENYPHRVFRSNVAPNEHLRFRINRLETSIGRGRAMTTDAAEAILSRAQTLMLER
jgi:hypothetical protein